jgi:phosphatidylglycerophosphatase GEP4
MEYFRQYPETGVTHPSHVAIVGDRLTTDIMMANMMGAWGFWVKDGVVPLSRKSIVSPLMTPRLEYSKTGRQELDLTGE